MTAEQAGLLAKARRSVHSAQALLLQKGLSSSKHSAVIAAFGQHFVKTGAVPAEFQRYLREGQVTRNISDYDIGPQVTVADTGEQIARAQRFLELAERLLA